MASLTTKTRGMWTCYAHPIELGGKQCGHENRGKPLKSGPLNLECCKGCGCTKIASDARKARYEETLLEVPRFLTEKQRELPLAVRL